MAACVVCGGDGDDVGVGQYGVVGRTEGWVVAYVCVPCLELRSELVKIGTLARN